MEKTGSDAYKARRIRFVFEKRRKGEAELLDLADSDGSTKEGQHSIIAGRMSLFEKQPKSLHDQFYATEAIQDEIPVVACRVSEERWLIITTRRVLWNLMGAESQLMLSDIVGIEESFGTHGIAIDWIPPEGFSKEKHFLNIHPSKMATSHSPWCQVLDQMGERHELFLYGLDRSAVRSILTFAVHLNEIHSSTQRVKAERNKELGNASFLSQNELLQRKWEEIWWDMAREKFERKANSRECVTVPEGLRKVFVGMGAYIRKLSSIRKKITWCHVLFDSANLRKASSQYTHVVKSIDRLFQKCRKRKCGPTSNESQKLDLEIGALDSHVTRTVQEIICQTFVKNRDQDLKILNIVSTCLRRRVAEARFEDQWYRECKTLALSQGNREWYLALEEMEEPWNQVNDYVHELLLYLEAILQEAGQSCEDA